MNSAESELLVDASVIIPAHNAADTIADQLDALVKQDTDARFEVIVVLNRCTDSTAAVVERFGDALDIRAIVADERPSAAYARNVGVDTSSAPKLLFCDADDRVGHRWVSALADALETADFAGGRLVIDLSAVPDWRRPPTGADPVDGGLHSWDARMLYPITASFACRRAAFVDAGGFDESYAGAASEDIDLALGLYRSGHLMGFASDATLLYRPRQNLQQMLRQSRSYTLGDAVLAAKEGRLIPVGRLRGAAQILATTAAKAKRSHTLHPQALFLAGAKAQYRLDAWRRVSAAEASGPQEVNPVVDYVVSLPGTTTRWFALSGRRDDARRYFRRQPDADVLAAMGSLMRTGDTMIDLEPNGGAVSIVAAWAAGPGGAVLSVEPSGPGRDILSANLIRHRCERIVRAVERVDLPSIPPETSLVRLDRELLALGSIGNYSALIDQTPNARYLVPRALLLDSMEHDATDRFLSHDWKLTALQLPDSASQSLDHASIGPNEQSTSDGYIVAERRR